jgi:hypothetical protein
MASLWALMIFLVLLCLLLRGTLGLIPLHLADALLLRLLSPLGQLRLFRVGGIPLVRLKQLVAVVAAMLVQATSERAVKAGTMPNQQVCH